MRRINMYYEKIETLYRQNLENRHMDGIHLPEMFKKSIEVIKGLNHVVIVTGFIVKAAMAGETDGPPGALIMARAFERLGKKVTLVTDSINENILKVGRDYLELDAKIRIATDDNMSGLTKELLKEKEGLGIIGIERPSRAKDNECYSMRGERLTPYVPNTDVIFEEAMKENIPTIGIGDGGNEVGMGIIRDYVEKHVPKGPLICANSEVDYLIIGGTSNWAAYGICAALSIVCKQNLLHSKEEEKGLLTAMIQVGAVDGMAKKPVLQVDGISFEKNAHILVSMSHVMESYL